MKALYCSFTLFVLFALCFLPVLSFGTELEPWIAYDDYGYVGHNLDSPIWHQITNPTTLSLSDDSARQVNIPFVFYFYGVAFNSIHISSNGLLCFTQSYDNYDNTYIPNMNQPNIFIAPFWDDLHPGSGRSISYGLAMNSPSPGSRKFVVTYQNVHFYSDDASNLTFQVVLNEGSNRINLTYLRMPTTRRGSGGGATIGIESARIPSPQSGIMYCLNQHGRIKAGMMLTFCPPPMCQIPDTPTPGPPTPTMTPTPTPYIPPLLDVRIKNVGTERFPFIELAVDVIDGLDQHIEGLTETDFTIDETDQQGNTVPQTIIPPVQSIKDSGTGVNLCLCLDVSGSMAGSNIEDMKRAIINFAYSIDCNDRLALVAFESSVRVLQNFTYSRYSIEQIIRATSANGSTALYDGIWESILLAQQESYPRAVIVFTDGDDNASTHTKSQVIQYAQLYNIPIYTIGLGASSSAQDLRDIADRTGGAYYFAPSAYDLYAIFQDIVEKIGSQYLLHYATTNPVPDGTRRTVKVLVGNALDTEDYDADDGCYFDANTFNRVDAIDSDLNHAVAQRFTAPETEYLSVVDLYFENSTPSIIETSIWSHDAGNNKPLVRLADSDNGRIAVTCEGWKQFSFLHVSTIELLRGESYWIVVEHLGADAALIPYSENSGYLASDGGFCTGAIAGNSFNVRDAADLNRDIYFKAMFCGRSGVLPTPTQAPPTPTMTPTRTPCSGRPVILMAGYWDTDIQAGRANTVTVFAWAECAEKVTWTTHYSSSGLDVAVYGDPRDGLFRCIGNFFFAPMPSSRIIMDLIATNNAGMTSQVWPYLNVE